MIIDKGKQRLAADLLQLVMQLNGSAPTSEHFFTREAGCSKIKQLCFKVVCTRAEWLGLQRDLFACIMPWALPLLDPSGISQLQPSVLGVRCD